jgi:4-hydroxyphenylpyruvate dioxygenase|tara:strand:+ start:2850 stop:3656 length:807 start_codon:yes stop_codon:yes gene_type:complete
MIPAIATVTLGGDIKNKLQAIANAGFHSIELFDTDLDTFKGSPKELGQLIHDFNLNLASYFPLRNFEGMPESKRSIVFENAQRYLDVAIELKASMVMICSNTDPISLSDDNRIAADLNQLGQIAKERDLKIAYEALAWGVHVNDYRHATRLVKDADHPSVGLVLDTFHILSRKTDVLNIRDIPCKDIFLVQISDAPILNLDYLNWSRFHRILPGEGEFALNDFVKEVKLTGYDGIVSLECFNEKLKADDPNIIAKKGFSANNSLWNTY